MTFTTVVLALAFKSAGTGALMLGRSHTCTILKLQQLHDNQYVLINLGVSQQLLLRPVENLVTSSQS